MVDYTRVTNVNMQQLHLVPWISTGILNMTEFGILGINVNMVQLRPPTWECTRQTSIRVSGTLVTNVNMRQVHPIIWSGIRKLNMMELCAYWINVNMQQLTPVTWRGISRENKEQTTWITASYSRLKRRNILFCTKVCALMRGNMGFWTLAFCGSCIWLFR